MSTYTHTGHLIGIGSASSDIGVHRVSADVPKDLAGTSLVWVIGARVGHTDGKSVYAVNRLF
jgi:hypothetical protein